MNGKYGDMNNSREEFKKIVDRCYERDLDELIYNSALSHATYLQHKLLQSAAKHKRPVRLVSARLPRLVYEQLADDLGECIGAEVPVEAVIMGEIDNADDNQFFQRLKGYPGATLYEPKNGINGGLPDMLVIGEQGFRYQVDASTGKARANFNDPVVAERLIFHFERYRDNFASKLAS